MPFMKQKFTPEDFVSYLYRETSASQRLAIEEALHRDPVLADELNELRRGKQMLPRVKFNAPDRALKNVLKYSQHRALEKHA
jgi:hypothetical protein